MKKKEIRNLKEIANFNEVNKFGFDDFSDIYEPFFNTFRWEKIKLLEIGIGGYDIPKEGGNSLRMWRDYFENAEIFGIDIFDKSDLESDRIKIFQGSQSDTLFLEQVFNVTSMLDIVIDDGSHVSSDVITSFKYFFPRINENGIYVIEDLGTSYWPEFGGGFQEDTSMNFLKRLTDCLNHKEFQIQNYEPNYFDENIKSIHFFRNAVIIIKGKNTRDSVMVKNGKLRI
jgi:hypothetical protein